MIIIARCIVVIEVKAHTKSLVGINSKFRVKIVFAELFVATILICNHSIWREGIHEQELVWLLEKETIGVSEHERTCLLAVYEDTTQAGCEIVARSIEITIHPCIEQSVHIKMMQSVRSVWYNVAKLSVDSPYIMTLRYLFVLCSVVVMLIEVPVLASLGDVTTLVNLTIPSVLGMRSEKQA